MVLEEFMRTDLLCRMFSAVGLSLLLLLQEGNCVKHKSNTQKLLFMFLTDFQYPY